MLQLSKFGHHESNCPADVGSVCERCGTGNHDHLTSQCQNQAKSSDCDVWTKEKEVMKIKVTQRLTYPEARKVYEQHKPEFTFSKVVSAMPKKPETKTASTQYNEKDSEITASSTVIIAREKSHNQNTQINQKLSSEKTTTQN